MSTYQRDGSPLFLMRLWEENNRNEADEAVAAPLGADGSIGSKWRGKLLHVSTGEARYFRSWPDLLSLLQSMFPEDAVSNPPESSSEP